MKTRNIGSLSLPWKWDSEIVGLNSKKIQLDFMIFPLMILEIQKFYEHILIKIKSDRNLIQIYHDLFNDPMYA